MRPVRMLRREYKYAMHLVVPVNGDVELII